MKKIVAIILAFGLVLLTLTACSTVEGVGKDLQKAGKAVENKAKKL